MATRRVRDRTSPFVPGPPVRIAGAPGGPLGGSSSGSASAVAQGLCDTALGTDTGGSVRVPASFCGLHGIRPTHGRLDLRGMRPQAPSSDTTGWLARDAETFARVSAVMLGEPIASGLPTRLVVAADAFEFADAETSEALQPLVRRLEAPVKERREHRLAPPGITVWARAQRTLQRWEARILALTAPGGLTGVPQVSLPGAHVGGPPVGLSVLGARGSDAMLVAVAKAMEAAR